MNSAWVLFNSATDVWPDGLGSSSGELGHNIMDHHYNLGARGTFEGYEDKYIFGKRPTDASANNEVERSGQRYVQRKRFL